MRRANSTILEKVSDHINIKDYKKIKNSKYFLTEINANSDTPLVI
jgi:hypothetical protein